MVIDREAMVIVIEVVDVLLEMVMVDISFKVVNMVDMVDMVLKKVKVMVVVMVIVTFDMSKWWWTRL